MRVSLITESPAHPEFAPMIEKAVEAAAPHVEEITELPLPEEVRVRLTYRTGFVFDVIAEQRRGLERDLDELDLSEREATDLRALLMAREEDLDRHWMLAGANTLVEGNGHREQPVILFMPDALYHQGAGQHEITMIVANELCHILQHHAGGGVISRAHTMACPELRGVAGYSHFVASGHALWCAQQVTQRLFGRQVGREPTGRASDAFKRYVRDELIPEQEQRAETAPEPLSRVWVPGRASTIDPPHEVYETGARWVAAVTERDGGLDRLNACWSDLSLLPTIEEARDVTVWWKRVTAQAPTAA
ncbi:hypothetical protein AB0B50_34265 [Streptomyces sp. NPDC041068]|uniref:hypothetical protein n=1 Tax=Streptomyces sp. NPDC041068 TaxID=3155130 RepID=UPI0033EE3C23